MADPSSTCRLFQHDRVAQGYVCARPFLHPQVFALVRDLIRPTGLFSRALDVGCGTGMSSVALRELAREVVGLDASLEMLRRARQADNVYYLAGSAEIPPFAGSSFDLVIACGSVDWVERSKFMPAVAALLKPDGWLVPLDFGDNARSPGIPGLHRWYQEVFLRRFPRPPSADPIIRCDEAAICGFSDPDVHHFAFMWPFTADRYAEFLLTESSVIAAVEYGRKSAREIGNWLTSELAPLFCNREWDIEFGGYIQLLRRV